MNDAALRFVRRVLGRQILVGLAAFLATALVAPRLLLLDADVAAAVIESVVSVGLAALLGAAVLTVIRLRKHRYVLRSLAVGTRAVEPEELAGLADLPNDVTLRFLLPHLFGAVALVVPGLRPAMLDGGRAASLVALSMTIVAAAALPHYVLIRDATNRLFEGSPAEPVNVLLEAEERAKRPANRVARRILLAVVAPVALVGVGAVLVTHAHLRAFIESTDAATATLVGQVGLEPGTGQLGEAARESVRAAVRPFGLEAWVERGEVHEDPYVIREQDGRLTAITPVDDGRAFVRFSATLSPAVVTPSVVVALLGVLVAAWIAAWLGRILAEDLRHSTYRVRLLGTDSVLRGATQISRPARFVEVAALGRAIEGLAERFRVFAEAHERALAARERAQKMRGLLFASVSHDLKSPLNAVLGLAELLALEDLGPSQRESLALVTTRGRELLALIETILDAARVDSGQLALTLERVEIDDLVERAVRTAEDLAGGGAEAPMVELAEGLPSVLADSSRLPQAIAVLIAHAMRPVAGEARTRPVRVRATLQVGVEKAVRIDVEYASRGVPAAELEALLARQSTSRGRGLTLGLNLARSVIELHGGTVEVEALPDGAPVARCSVPLVPPKPVGRRRLSTHPTLG